MSVHWSEVEVSLCPQRFSHSVGPRPLLAGRDWFRASLQDYDLWFCTAGRGRLEIDTVGSFTLQRGSVVLFRPGLACQCWQAREDPTLCMYYFHFDLLDKGTGRRVPPGALADLPIQCDPEDSVFFEVLCQKILAALRSAQHAGGRTASGALARDQANSLFRGLLLELDFRSKAQTQLRKGGFKLAHYKMVMDIVAKIHSEPTRYRSTRDLAQACSASPDHFARVFKAILGKTPTQLLIDAKIQRAKQLLLDPLLGTAEIAHELDYENKHFFYRQFKERTGLTPTEFRASCAYLVSEG